MNDLYNIHDKYLLNYYIWDKFLDKNFIYTRNTLMYGLKLGLIYSSL